MNVKRPLLGDLKPLSLLHPGLMTASKRSASLQGPLMVPGTQEASASQQKPEAHAGCTLGRSRQLNPWDKRP